jgi:hypothetical protein
VVYTLISSEERFISGRRAKIFQGHSALRISSLDSFRLLTESSIIKKLIRIHDLWENLPHRSFALPGKSIFVVSAV